MDCLEFRTRYSDFADGLFDEVAEISARRHLSDCPPCRRFHETFVRGVGELRRRPPLAPSGDFALRLERRLHAERTSVRYRLRRRPGAAATLIALTVMAGGMTAYRIVAGRQHPAAQAPGAGAVPLLSTAGHHERAPGPFAGAVNDVAVQNPLRAVSEHPSAFRPHGPSYSGQLTASWTGR
jgi:anti-sigma factor RsiW